MKYLKTLGLLAVSAVVLMAFAGTASATVTSGGSAYTGEIVASSTNTELDGTVDIKCKKSTVGGSISSGATTAAISTLTFTECGTDTVSVIGNHVVIGPFTYYDPSGSLRIDSDGTVFAEGFEVTVQVHRTVLGFPITTHCIYATASNPGTDVGDLIEGSTFIALAGTNLPQKSTDGACGSNAQWTGFYTISKPGPLTID